MLKLLLKERVHLGEAIRLRLVTRRLGKGRGLPLAGVIQRQLHDAFEHLLQLGTRHLLGRFQGVGQVWLERWFRTLLVGWASGWHCFVLLLLHEVVASPRPRISDLPVVCDIAGVLCELVSATRKSREFAAGDAVRTEGGHYPLFDAALAAEVATPRPDLDNRHGQETEAAWTVELCRPVEVVSSHDAIDRFREPRNDGLILQADHAVGVDSLDKALTKAGKV